MSADKLTKEDIHKILSQTLPEQNDFFKTDYSEELQELLDFGIDTDILLLDVVVKHRPEVLRIDESELDEFHIKHYGEELGKGYVEERVKNKFWFAYPALLRIILELEFGQKYIEYANKRDNI